METTLILRAPRPAFTHHVDIDRACQKRAKAERALAEQRAQALAMVRAFLNRSN